MRAVQQQRNGDQIMHTDTRHFFPSVAVGVAILLATTYSYAADFERISMPKLQNMLHELTAVSSVIQLTKTRMGRLIKKSRKSSGAILMLKSASSFTSQETHTK